jgi:hypothetical protein
MTKNEQKWFFDELEEKRGPSGCFYFFWGMVALVLLMVIIRVIIALM